MRLCGTETSLQNFVIKCWSFAVHDLLGERMNWKGGKDKRVVFPGEPWPTRKIAVEELRLLKTMLIIIFTFKYF